MLRVTKTSCNRSSSYGSLPSSYFVNGDQAFFRAETWTHGSEAWRTDGTPEGTYLLQDVDPGIGWSNPQYLGNIGEKTVFTAYNDEVNDELFVTDGTIEGTELLKDIWPGGTGSFPNASYSFNDQVLFSANSGDGFGLWRTDGTTDGTIKIGSVDPSWQWATLGDYAYFNGYSESDTGEELWRTDGTADGTSLVADIVPGTNSSDPGGLATFDSKLIFAATTPSEGREMWVSDGTAAGTQLLKDIVSGSDSSDPFGITLIDTGVLFLVTNSSFQEELWITDGTTAGTTLVHNFGTSSASLYYGTDSKAYLAVDQDNLWETDGTAAGTKPVDDGGTGAASSFGFSLVVAGEVVFFTAGGTDEELWKIQGGVVSRVADIRPGAEGSEPHSLTVLGNQVLFTADDGVTEEEPWISDGTAEGTRQLKDIEGGTDDGAYGFTATLNDAALFTGFAADTGWELWKTDGTEPGTQLVKDINPGTGRSGVLDLYSDEQYVYFRANDGSTGVELWRSDGTTDGTVRIDDFNSGSGGSFPDHITLFEGSLYFAATTAAGRQLIRLNPTTLEWTAIEPSSGVVRSPAELIVLGDKLLFSAKDAGNNTEFWSTDGTSAGTQLVLDIYPGSTGSVPNELTVFGDKVIFRARHPDTGDEPWISDGTTAGTVPLADIYAGTQGSSASNFTTLDGHVFFRALTPSEGMEVWRTDGTTGGTQLHAEIGPGTSGSFPDELTKVGDQILFFADDSVHGDELWRTSLSETALVKDIRPGWVGSLEYDLDPLVIDGLFYFTANDAIGGEEPWVSDGTSEGTHRLADVTGDSGGSYVSGITKLGPRHLISGYTDDYGAELFIEANLAPTDILLTPSDIDENRPANSVIGVLSAEDPNPWDAATFTLVSGAGDTNNDLVGIDGEVLSALNSFDHESNETLSIRVRATDIGGETFEKALEIIINDVNESPSDIGLGNDSVDENAAVGTAVGSLSTVDPDAGDTFTYTLVAGAGDADNAQFQVVGSELQTAAVFDFESTASYQIRLRSTDAGGLNTEKTFTINVNDVNESPSDIGLGNDSVDENAAVGTAVGSLSTVDPDAGDTFTYTLVAGAGDADNAQFQVVGSELQTAAVFDFESTASYQIRLRSTDAGGLNTEKTFTINVNDVNESPSDIGLGNDNIDENAAVGTAVGSLSTVDPDAGDTFTYTLVAGAGDADNAQFQVVGSELQTAAVFDFESTASYQIRLRSTDAGGLNTEKTFTVSVNDVNESPSDIGLDGSSVDENAAVGTAVGSLSTVDPDAGDTFTYTLVAGAGDTDNAQFQVVGSELQTAAVFDFESTASYQIRLRSTDAGGLNTEKTFTVSVNDVNESPSDIGLDGSSVDENAAVGTAVGSLSTVDPDAGDTFTYTLVAGAGDTDNAQFQIVGNELQTAAVFDFESQSSYQIRLRSTDASGLNTEKTFTINVNDVNESPSDIGLDGSSVDENAAVGTAVGSLSTVDPDAGDTFTYTLVAGAGDTDNAQFQIVGNELQTAAVFDFESQSSYQIRLRSTDASGLNTEKTFTINVNDVNESPSDIGLDGSSVDENAAVGTAVGSLSTVDPDAGDTFTYTLVAGAGDTDNAQFQIVGGELQTAAVFDFEAKASYQIRIRSTDAGGLSAEDSFTINITDINEAPTGIGLDNSSVDENVAVGTGVGNLTTTDPDAGDSFTYTLVAGAGDSDNAQFQIVGGELQTAAAFDFESKSSYQIRIRSTDAGGLSAEGSFTINITNINESPTAIGLDNDSVDENSASGTSVGNLTTTDPDAGDSFTYTLVAGAGDSDNAQFQIVAGELQTAAAFDFESKSSYQIRIRSTDAGGLSTEDSFTINITDINEAPTGIGLDNNSIDENAAVGTGVGNLSTTDPDAGDSFTYTLVAGAGDSDNAQFQIVGGELQTAAVFDFEAKASYQIRIRSTDAGGLSTEDSFTINITDINEAPTAIGLDNDSVDENSASGTSVGNLSTTDPDAGDSFTYTLVVGAGDSDNAQFQIVGGELQTAAVFDFEAKASYQIRIRSTDAGGLSAEDSFTINITDINEAPTAIGLDNDSVDENSASGTSVGNLSTTDPDAGDSFTYTLVAGAGDSDNAQFQIVAGELQTAAAFDFESKSSYQIRIRSTDAGGLSTEDSFTINITDINEAPTGIGLDNNSIDENAAVGSGVGNLSTTDPDAGDSFTYTLVVGAGDSDNAQFQIVGGELQTAAVFDFEAKASYQIRIRSTDAGGLSTEDSFTINITDINEAPNAIGIDNSSVDENAAVGTGVGNLSTTDPDAGDSFTYTLVAGAGDSDNAKFQIVAGELQTAVVFDFELQQNYTTRVRTTDTAGLFFEEVVSISINDIQEYDFRDTNEDGLISPIDVLLIINHINSTDDRNTTPSTENLDVNEDGLISPIDVLLVINYFDEEGEGESRLIPAALSQTQPVLTPAIVDDYFGNFESKRKRWWQPL